MTKKDIKEIIAKLMEKGVLASPDFFDNETKAKKIISNLDKDISSKVTVVNEDVRKLLVKEVFDANWDELDRLKVISEKNDSSYAYNSMIEHLLLENKENDEIKSQKNESIEILFSYDKPNKQKNVESFVKYYNNRFRTMERMLSSRPELSSLTAVTRVLQTKEKQKISIIGMVVDKRVSANKNIILEVEDLTGRINVLVNKNRKDLYDIAKSIVNDEIIGISGATPDGGGSIIFCDRIIFPDVPTNNILKKGNEEEFAIFLSDIHIGSNMFMKHEFERFIDWINGKIGNDKQKEIVSKIKYIFIAGDLVDGVGVYPGQEQELEVDDIYKQYELCAEYLNKIPKDIQIIACPGNHDATRISEPQPILDNEFAKALKTVPHLTMVSNPSIINIAKKDDFQGFSVLLYHGYSFDYYVANVDSVRSSGGYDRGDLVMKFLLQRRHLAPSHKSTLYIPDEEKDPLVIEDIPDFFVCGHIHKVAVSDYKGVSLVCGSCWQDRTSFQEKVGHHPEPARVPMVNLKTREMKILNFSRK